MQRQAARVVCVAGNSIETPRLLLMSASSRFKDGLANSSGQVGRNYMRHTTGSVYAVFDEPVHMYHGTTMAGIVQDEAGHDEKRGFVGGMNWKPWHWACRFMLPSLIRAVGAPILPRIWMLMITRPACGLSVRICHAPAIVLP